MSKSSNHSAHRIPPYRRPIIVVSFLTVLAIAIVVTLIIFMNINHAEEPSPAEPEKTTPTTPVVTKPEEPDEPPLEPEDKVNQYEGEDPNTLEELTGRVAYKGVNREPNYQSLTISASIDQYLQSAGACTLSLKDIGGLEVYANTLPAQPDVTTSACGPFEISISDFSPGAYQIEITVSGDGKTGLITDTVQL